MSLPAPPDALEIFLQPGEFYFGEEKTRIRTLLGSCVAISLWHPRLRIGGMCHYMLPHRPHRRGDEPLDGRYADEAMHLFLCELRRSGTLPAEYHVKLFGGGQMFQPAPGASRHANISERNMEAGRALIVQHGFRSLAQDLGGEGHRNVILDLWSGDVWLKRAGARPGHGEPLDGRYADEAMQLFMRELRRSRTEAADYHVKLFGGGQMFRHETGTRRHVDISQRNMEAGRELVVQHGFRLQAHDMGGEGHRNVILDLWSGDVWLKRATLRPLAA